MIGKDRIMIDKCEWTYNEDGHWEYWDTSCGKAFLFSEGTPEDSGFKFCPYCGKELKEIKNG